jgi:hypothetical protein
MFCNHAGPRDYKLRNARLNVDAINSESSPDTQK